MCIDFKIRISVHPKEISTDYFRHPRTPIRVYRFAYGYLVNLILGALIYIKYFKYVMILMPLSLKTLANPVINSSLKVLVCTISYGIVKKALCPPTSGNCEEPATH